MNPPELGGTRMSPALCAHIRRSFACTATAVCIAQAPAQPDPTPPVPPPWEERTVLPNGLTVLTRLVPAFNHSTRSRARSGTIAAGFIDGGWIGTPVSLDVSNWAIVGRPTVLTGRVIHPWQVFLRIEPPTPSLSGTRTIVFDSDSPVSATGATQEPTKKQTIAEDQPVSLSTSARLSLDAGDALRAVQLFEAHLAQDPDDFAAMRTLGLILAMNDREDDGFALVAEAYGSDLGLAEQPVQPWIEADRVGWRRGERDVMRRMALRPSANGWLTAAVMKQATGDVETAERLIRNAAELGLDSDIAKAMLDILGN